MVEVVLNVNKTVEENATYQFERAKKAKAKLKGAQEALERSLQRLSKEEAPKRVQAQAQAKETIVAPKKWYHKFRWFKTSEGFLAIGGRDSTTNDLVIKKHTEPGDLVFHTEMPGSPFFILKARGGDDGKDKGAKEFPQASKDEVASATATFSKAWTRGLGAVEVYCIAPEQVRKELGLPKGAFMIHGKREYFTATLDLCIGLNKEGEVLAGPKSAIKIHCPKYFILIAGERSASDTAKVIQKHLGGDLDSIIRSLPGGTFKVTASWDIGGHK